MSARPRSSPVARLHRRVRASARLRIERAKKYARVRRQGRRDQPKTPVYIVGCQRSGTTMLIETLERSPFTWVYHEDRGPAFANFRLREKPVIDALIRRSFARCVVFKPICDSHLTDELLERHDGSKALWIYRDVRPVVASAVRKWDAHQRDVMDWIHAGDWERLGWRGERLSPETRSALARCYRPDLSLQEGAALFWWMRNRFFFELGLDADERVLLLRYEDLVTKPEASFERVFSFLGCPFSPALCDEVSPRSLRTSAEIPLAPEIESLCRDMTERLDRELAGNQL